MRRASTRARAWSEPRLHAARHLCCAVSSPATTSRPPRSPRRQALPPDSVRAFRWAEHRPLPQAAGAADPRQAAGHLGWVTGASQQAGPLLTDEGSDERLHLERLPAYAPDVNPVELVWSYLTRVELRNACFLGLGWLEDGLVRTVKRLRHRRPLLRSFIHQVGDTRSRALSKHSPPGWQGHEDPVV